MASLSEKEGCLLDLELLMQRAPEETNTKKCIVTCMQLSNHISVEYLKIYDEK